MKGESQPGSSRKYDDAYVQALFDRMGPTYDLVNFVSSFGFSEWWRRQCVSSANISSGDRVCDMMSGSGECWRYVLERGASVVSVDFSQVMTARQTRRNATGKVDVRCENAVRTSVESNSIDCVISAFGLKTLGPEALLGFAREIRRILKPGGRLALIEISSAEGWWLGPLYRFYLRRVIPIIGKLCLGDIECYRMLGIYTEEFGSCDRLVAVFAEEGLMVTVQLHFNGCATSIIGSKAG